MLEDEWLAHGPASINLLLERQDRRDNLHKLCAGTIVAASPFAAKGTTAATIFPELIPPKTPEEIKEEEREKFRLRKERIENAKKNAKRDRKLEN